MISEISNKLPRLVFSDIAFSHQASNHKVLNILRFARFFDHFFIPLTALTNPLSLLFHQLNKIGDPGNTPASGKDDDRQTGNHAKACREGSRQARCWSERAY